MKARKITEGLVMASPVATSTITSGSAVPRRSSDVTARPSPVSTPSNARSHEDDFIIVRPREPIPIERTLNGRHLILHFGRTAVVLTASEARRLAYSLLLEAERPGRSDPS